MPEAPYALFNVTLRRKIPLSPTLWRLTFTGPTVGRMTTRAPDQRIKIFFPEGRAASTLPSGPDWYAVYRSVEPVRRAPMRTYTIRYLRPEEQELDVDFALHGGAGPASRWALRAEAGDGVQIAAPNRAYDGDSGGYEWNPPAGFRHLLLMGDETALPAAAGILETLASSKIPPRTQAFIEVPARADRMELPSWSGLSLQWLTRDGVDRPSAGALLMAAARHAVSPPEAGAADIPLPLPEIDIDANLLWERAAPAASGFYGWIAGEAGAVMAIRHLLVRERGLDRRAFNLMGYWRRGKSLE